MRPGWMKWRKSHWPLKKERSRTNGPTDGLLEKGRRAERKRETDRARQSWKGWQTKANRQERARQKSRHRHTERQRMADRQEGRKPGTNTNRQKDGRAERSTERKNGRRKDGRKKERQQNGSKEENQIVIKTEKTKYTRREVAIGFVSKMDARFLPIIPIPQVNSHEFLSFSDESFDELVRLFLNIFAEFDVLLQLPIPFPRGKWRRRAANRNHRKRVGGVSAPPRIGFFVIIGNPFVGIEIHFERVPKVARSVVRFHVATKFVVGFLV